jgi:peptidoglycan L-alanyl-D-glutamate endopeptidase CwlK
MKIMIFAIVCSFIFSVIELYSKEPQIIIDSDISLNEAIKGTKAPKDLIDKLIILNVEYYSLDSKLHRGQLVIHKNAEKDIKIIFEMIKESKFPIAKVLPINNYNWDDSASMEDNNTSAFNYRNIAGTTRLSNHSFGLAVDINPFFNPVVYKDGKTSPAKAKHEKNKPGTFHAEHPIVLKFKELGWRWGGEFSKYKDNHHFDKNEN